MNISSDSLKSLKKTNPWGIAAIFVLLIDLFFIGLYGYNLLELSRTNDILEKKEEIVQAKNKEIADMKKDIGYMKYLSSKKVFAASKQTKWKERNEYLIDLIIKLNELDKSDNTIELSNLNITDTSVTLNGSTIALERVYSEGGVIDTFNELDFIKEITIPYYRRGERKLDSGDVENVISFTLNAKIIEYGGNSK